MLKFKRMKGIGKSVAVSLNFCGTVVWLSSCVSVLEYDEVCVVVGRDGEES